jgi:large subunit ribosomal protein L19
MALLGTHNDSSFGIGDTVRVHLRISEGEKTRIQQFEGMVIAIQGRGDGKSFIVRRVGEQKVGIEQIFPFASPSIDKVEVVRTISTGVSRAKLYYTREKSAREIDQIRTRSIRRTSASKK